MADGTQLNAPTTSGDKVWTEDTGDARGKIQRVKIALGALGVDGGDVAPANPIPVREQPIGLTEIAINVSASGDNVLIAGVVGQTIKIWKLFVEFNGDCEYKFRDSAGTDLTGPIATTQGGELKLERDGDPWFTCPVGTGLNLNLSMPVQASGRLYCTQG